MAEGLTQRQGEVMRFIRSHFAQHNSAPTINEIAQHFSMSDAGAWYHVKALARKGELRVEHNKARGIFLTEWDEYRPGITFIPLFNEEACLAGATRTREQFNASALGLSPDHDYFCMRISSKLLENLAVRPGDLLVFRRTKEAADGQVVIAALEGGERLELRRISRHGGKIILQAECDSVGNISCSSCSIQAVLHSMVRFFG